MATKFAKVKQTIYPNPHDIRLGWTMGLETGLADQSTIIPLVMHDEALSASALKTNPQNTSFAQDTNPNCYPGSQINTIVSKLQFSLTKGALHTDNIDALKIAFMPIFTSFKDDLTAVDELTGTETQDVLHLQSESTDRQTYPLWNGVDQTERWNTSSYLGAKVPGLTTNQTLESVAFNAQTYYNAQHFYSISNKLKTLNGGLQWITLTRQKPTVTINIKQTSKTKFINPYAFFGVLIHLPKGNQFHQIPTATDVTNIQHVTCIMATRYNEWNDKFNSDK